VNGVAGSAASSGSGGTEGSTAGAAAVGGNGTAGAGVAGTGGSAAVDCSTAQALTPGETTESVMVGGMARTFVRHVPQGYTGEKPVPVVIDFHPLGSSGSGWKGSTGWAELADQEGFIVIWPDGVGNSWNAGRCCRTAMEQNIDDIAFTRAIITSLQKDACIDRKRVYATGCSNGGGMAFRVACDAADVIAGVAPVDFDCVTSAAVNEPSCGPECAPSRPISEIQFRGTADALVPYEGGMRDGGTTTFPGAEQTFGSWGEINMCSDTPVALPGRPSCEQYPMCSNGVSTVLCTIENGSHCGSYQTFDIVSVAWELLQAETLH
jgi:polyhydroxybutyrate depolymerase